MNSIDHVIFCIGFMSESFLTNNKLQLDSTNLARKHSLFKTGNSKMNFLLKDKVKNQDELIKQADFNCQLIDSKIDSQKKHIEDLSGNIATFEKEFIK